MASNRPLYMGRSAGGGGRDRGEPTLRRGFGARPAAVAILTLALAASPGCGASDAAPDASRDSTSDAASVAAAAAPAAASPAAATIPAAAPATEGGTVVPAPAAVTTPAADPSPASPLTSSIPTAAPCGAEPATPSPIGTEAARRPVATATAGDAASRQAAPTGGDVLAGLAPCGAPAADASAAAAPTAPRPPSSPSAPSAPSAPPAGR